MIMFTNEVSRAVKSELTGAISAPFNDLTRQWHGYRRTDYHDGLVCYTYARHPDGERTAFLIFDSYMGHRHGFLWATDVAARGVAIRQYRGGKRANHHAIRLMRGH